MCQIRRRAWCSSAHTSLGMAVTTVREREQATVPEVARVSGLGEKWLRRTEAGNVDVSFGKLLRIAVAIGVPLSTVMDEFVMEESALYASGVVAEAEASSSPQLERFRRVVRANAALRPWPIDASHVSLGRAVELKRATRGLSRRDLGRFSGRGQRFIVALERGKVDPTVSELLAVADTLRISLWHLSVAFEDQQHDSITE